VYVGRISRGRGVDAMLEVARRLVPSVRLELVGDADVDVRNRLAAAVAAGTVVWHGFVPADRAVALLRGARVGLCLLADEPNYRVSLPTKVVEYLAHGVPVVATPLPAVAALLADGGGAVVPFDDVEAATAAVRELVTDDDLHARAVVRARGIAADLTWEAEGGRLVDALRRWAA
jgi:glycosyltransferase involved in cell wall biosynthesis